MDFIRSMVFGFVGWMAGVIVALSLVYILPPLPYLAYPILGGLFGIAGMLGGRILEADLYQH